MHKLLEILRKPRAGEEGATLVEYALLLGLIAVVTLAMISLIGTSLSSFFTSAAASI
ncbi:MAG: Flp family type IVb pilin [Gemmataceae bacterium]